MEEAAFGRVISFGFQGNKTRGRREGHGKRKFSWVAHEMGQILEPRKAGQGKFHWDEGMSGSRGPLSADSRNSILPGWGLWGHWVRTGRGE